MPRTARKISSTGIYHVIMRGINQEYIFQKNGYKHKMLCIIKEKINDIPVEIYGYCIMDNHIHIILKSDASSFSMFMSKVNNSYARYYNCVNERNGYVFQNRFKSYPIENERYFLSCLRYIHNNPVKAGIVKNVHYYKWSSYCGYLNENDPLLDDKAYTLVKNNFTNKDSYAKFHLKNDYDLYPDIEEDVNVIKDIISEHILEVTLDTYNLSSYLELCTDKPAMEYLKTELKEHAKLNAAQIKEFTQKHEGGRRI